jgi:hypothetical protein
LKPKYILARSSFVISTFVVFPFPVLFPTLLEASTRQMPIRHFAGIRNLPAQARAASQTAKYADLYPTAQSIPATETAEGYAKAGDKLATGKKWKDAEKEYRKAVKLEPNQAEWYGKVGFALLNQKKWKDSVSTPSRWVPGFTRSGPL